MQNERRPWSRQLAILWAGQFTGISGVTIVYPFMPLLVETTGVHDPGAIALWSGAMFTISQTGVAIFSPIWGRMADRVGRKPMLVRAMIGVGIALILSGYAPNVFALFVVRFFTGAFAGTGAAANALVASSAPPERVAQSLGVVQSGSSIGSIVGPGLGAVLVPLIGIRPSFAIAGTMCIAAGLWTAFGVDEHFVRPDRSRQRPRALAVIRAEGVGSSVFTLMVLATLAQCITIGLTPVTPLRSAHLADSHHVAVSVGAVAAVQSAFTALAALTVARVAMRVQYRAVLVGAALWASAAYLLVGLASGLGPMLIFIAMVGLGTGALVPSINTLIGKTAPLAVRAEVFGYSQSLQAMGGAVAPLLTASLVASHGTSAPFFMAATLEVLLAGWAALRIAPRLRPVPVPAATHLEV
jgi:MFS family permease